MLKIYSKKRLTAAVPFTKTVKDLTIRFLNQTNCVIENHKGMRNKVQYERLDQQKARFTYHEKDLLFPSVDDYSYGQYDFSDSFYSEDMENARQALAQHIVRARRALGLPSGLKLKRMPQSKIREFIKGNVEFKINSQIMFYNQKDFGPYYIENYEVQTGIYLTWVVFVSNPNETALPAVTGFIEFKGSPIANKTSEFVKFPSVQPGSIFVKTYFAGSVWSEFYEVVKRTEQTVYVRELRKANVDTYDPYHSTVKPIPGAFADEPVRQCKLVGTDDNPYISLGYRETAGLWDGKPVYEDTLD